MADSPIRARVVRRSVCAPLAALCIVAATARAQATGRRSEIIRGTVSSDSGRVMPGVTVIATMAPDRTFHQSVSDSSGRFVIRFDQGTGDYLVYAAPPGYRAFRRRIAIGPTGEITLDIRLASAATSLGTVQVVAQRPRPLPDGGQLRDPAAADYNAQTLNGALPPELAGNLDALAANTPGLTVTPDGRLSAFGLPGQVSASFNGMSFGGGEIPRDARVAVRVISSAFDPSIGGFGGARINVEMAQGGRVSEQFGRLTLDAPALQYTDANANGVGQRFGALAINANADGPFGSHDAWYNSGLSVRRMSASSASLLDAGASALSLAGVAADSVARMRSIATALGIPLSTSAVPHARIDERGSLLLRLDHYRDPGRYQRLWTNAVSLTGVGSFARSENPGSGLTSAPALGRSAQSVNGQLIGQWLHMTDAYSTELTSSLRGARSTSDPYLRLPSALVRVESQFGGDDPVSRSLTIGGAGETPATSNLQSETVGVLNFYATPSHKVRIFGRSQVGAVHVDANADQFGTFTFNSLADLEANRPSSFSRALATPAASSVLWNGAFAIGDVWQVTPVFQVEPGVRFEANHFLPSIAANPAVDPLGVSNTHAPNTLHASPRLGFAWTYRPTRANVATGTATTGRIWLPPRAVLSGGIGEFRQDLSADALLPALTATGLASASSQLFCVGSATPLPDWTRYGVDRSAVPTTCAAGAPSAFVDGAPNVSLFSPSFALARSWRGNLRFGSALGLLRYSLDGWYSYNLNQPGTLDANFADRPRFSLADEADRPVFVSASSIVPGTGIVSLTDARRERTVGRVSELVSDLHSTARQLTLIVTPELSRGVFSVAYTMSDVNATARGFDDATFGSPTALAAGRAPFDARHHLIVSAGYQWGSAVGLSLGWNIASGTPYTPIVASDINGDGLANDRAFVFDPAAAADASLARDLRTLMAAAPSQARDCLRRQLGAPAARNGCEGPWTSSMNAALSTGYMHVLDGRLMVASLNFTNPLGGLDQLLHGENGLHGWGTSSRPDPVLYTVRGFDPTLNRFQYAVNPRFGSTRSSQTTLRAPFRVSLDVRLELGQPLRRKEFERFLQMAPLRQNRARAPEDSLRARLADYEVVNYYDVLERMRDSLLLTRDQVGVLESARASYLVRADSVWRNVAAFIASRSGDDYDVNDIRRRVDATALRAWALEREEVPRIRAVMTPAQLELVDVILRSLVESDKHLPPRPHLF